VGCVSDVSIYRREETTEPLRAGAAKIPRRICRACHSNSWRRWRSWARYFWLL